MRRFSLVLAVLAGCSAAAPVGSLSGKVVLDGDSDASGVSVVATGPVIAIASTDARGQWSLPNLPGGRYALLFTAADTRERTQSLSVSVSSDSATPDVRFTAVGSVSGLVTGVSGFASVFIEGADALAACGPDGRYRIDAVPAGTRTVDALAAGYSLATQPGVVVVRGRTTEAPVLALTPGAEPAYPVASLLGVAQRLDQSDHSGTRVTATAGSTQASAVTAADGSYRLDGLPSGVYSLRFDYGGASEIVPQVLALPGTTGQVVDGALYPLSTNPLKLPEGRRLPLAGSWRAVDHDHVLVMQPDPDAGNDLYRLSALTLSSGAIAMLDEGLLDLTPVAVVSPDRNWAAYAVTSGGELRTVRLSGGPPVHLGALSNFSAPVFSPDSAFVLYREDDGSLSSIPSVGGTPVTLASSAGEMALHPDGKRLVYNWCSGAGDCRVSIRAIDGHDAPVDLLLNAKGTPILTPGGAYVLVIANWQYYPGTGQLLAAATDGSGARTLWDGVLADSLVLSADGDQVAFFTDGADLRTVDLSTNQAPAVLASNVASTFFSHDGKRILYSVLEDDPSVQPPYWSLTQQASSGGSLVPLVMKTNQFVLGPDGQRTLFADNLDFASGLGRLVSADAGGQLTVLASGVYNFSFTPDSAHALFTTADPQTLGGYLLSTISPSGGVAVSLGPVASGSVSTSRPYLPSPNGSSVALIGADQLVRVAPSGGGALKPAALGTPTWLDDTRLLIYQYTPPPYSFQSGTYVWDVTP